MPAGECMYDHKKMPDFIQIHSTRAELPQEQMDATDIPKTCTFIKGTADFS
jgi:hypothetical protein